MKNKKIPAIDLFSGCGGVSIGLTNAGFDVKVAIEIDPAAVEVYKKYKPLSKVNVLQEDIRNVSGQIILEKGNIDSNSLFLLAGCPPCQNFSLQNRYGSAKNDEVKKELLFEYLKIVQDIYPPFILLENVPGIKSPSNINILNEFLNELKCDKKDDNKSYYLKYDVLNSADYGVPQSRKRFVLHGVRKDIYEELKKGGLEFDLPVCTHSKTGENGLKKWITVRESIMDLPAINAGEKYNGPDVLNHKSAGLSDVNLERIRLIRENGGSREGLPERLVLNCHKEYTGHKDVYGIMDLDLPAPTITGGCLSYSKGRFGHPTQDRAISIREAARLQTFPDDFEFSDNTTKSALQIGNAVPVKLVESSARTLIKYFSFLKNKRG